MLKSLRVQPLLLITVLILTAALCRLLPHWPNFTPIGAMALFGAAHFSRKSLAFIVPALALYLSDLLLNNWIYAEYYPTFTWAVSPYVYGAFGLIVLLGFLLRGRVRPLPVVGTALTSSMIFFLVTNYGSWLADPIYTKDTVGLLAAYTAGLPFFLNTVAGDLFFSGLLFGGYALLRPSRTLATARVQ